jgi:hypothetical protein
MKKFLFPIAMFFTGLILGVGAMLIVIQKGPTQVLANQWNAVIHENVVYATLLHDQKYADLNRLIETNIVDSFASMESLGFVDERQSSAQLVRGYYDLTGTKTPDLVDPYLSGVKGTDVRRLASAEVEFNNKH